MLDQYVPVEVFGGGTNWSVVSGGSAHTCALKTTGRLYCWGYDNAGQVGDGAPEVNQAIPVEVAGGATNWTSVDAGGADTCALRSTGRLWCWGGDGGGQLGNGGANVNQPAPVLVAGGATNWTSVERRFVAHAARAGRPVASTAGAPIMRASSATADPTRSDTRRPSSPWGSRTGPRSRPAVASPAASGPAASSTAGARTTTGCWATEVTTSAGARLPGWRDATPGGGP